MSAMTVISNVVDGTKVSSAGADARAGAGQSPSPGGAQTPSTSLEAGRSNSTLDLSKESFSAELNRSNERQKIILASTEPRVEPQLNTANAQANSTGSAGGSDPRNTQPAAQLVYKSGPGEQQAQGQESKKEVDRREEDLKKREAEVERRAAELRNLEAMLKNISEMLAEISKAQNAADEEKTSKLTGKINDLFAGLKAFMKAFAGHDTPTEEGPSKKKKPQPAKGETNKEEATKTIEAKKTEGGSEGGGDKDEG